MFMHLLLILVALMWGSLLLPLHQLSTSVSVQLTPDLLAGVAGMALSLIFSYVPGIADWYNNALDGTQKRLVMLVLLLLTTAAIMGLGCAGVIGGVNCTQQGFIDAFFVFLTALLTNQAINTISPVVGKKQKKLAFPDRFEG